LPFSLISKYFTGILLGKFKIKEFNLIGLFTSLFNLVGVIFLLIFFNKGILSLILLSVLISISTCSIYIFLIGKLTNYKLSFRPEVFKKTTNFGIKGYFANIFGFLNYRLDMLLVNFFVGVTQVGYYSIAVGIAELMWFIPDSIQTILFPRVASRDSNSKQAEEMTAVLCRNTVFITSALCVGLAIFGRELIRILFGSVYLPSFMPLLILLPGVIATALGKVTASYLAGVGKPIFATYSSLATLIVNIMLNVLLIPKWGIAGAAFATSVAYMLDSSILLYAFLKTSNIKLSDILIIKSRDFLLYRDITKKLAGAIRNK
jgi:O-antigen/teichoic acid export membrane protein